MAMIREGEDLLGVAGRHLPDGVRISAHVQHGRRLVLALEGGEVPLGWLDTDADEPRLRTILCAARPVQALLPHGDGVLAISDEDISRYRWPEAGAEPERVQRALLPLGGRRLLSAVGSPRHVALLATQCGPLRGRSRLHGLLKDPAPDSCRMDLLLVLDASSFREVGAAAFEQTWNRCLEEPPSPRWTRLELSPSLLEVHCRDASVRRIELGEGDLADLQDRLNG